MKLTGRTPNERPHQSLPQSRRIMSEEKRCDKCKFWGWWSAFPKLKCTVYGCAAQPSDGKGCTEFEKRHSSPPRDDLEKKNDS